MLVASILVCGNPNGDGNEGGVTMGMRTPLMVIGAEKKFVNGLYMPSNVGAHRCVENIASCGCACVCVCVCLWKESEHL